MFHTYLSGIKMIVHVTVKSALSFALVLLFDCCILSI